MKWLYKAAGIVDPNKQIVSADEIIPGLWLGNQASSSNIKFIEHNNITVIINASKHIPNSFDGRGIQYYNINVNDPQTPYPKNDEDIRIMKQKLPGISNIIDYHLKKGDNVLVHCHAGIQRSATIVAYYLIHHKKIDFNHSVGYVVKMRPVAFYGGSRIHFINSF